MTIVATPSGEDTSGYRAFLSYSHRDASFARKLHQRLETYRVPASLVGQPTGLGPIPKRIAPIFRDRDELSSAADLGEKIRDALQLSRSLVVAASPASARSPWVEKEVRAFKALGRADRVFTIIVDGEPNASDRPGLEAQECFCPALRFAVDAAGELTTTRAEPLAADARKAGDGRDDAVLRVIAGLLGVGFDRLRQRERTRRRRRRLALIPAGVIAAVAAAFAYASLADLNVAVPGAHTIRTELRPAAQMAAPRRRRNRQPGAHQGGQQPDAKAIGLHRAGCGARRRPVIQRGAVRDHRWRAGDTGDDYS
jgi:eukaryotic-like serine/threonine-protein kinase